MCTYVCVCAYLFQNAKKRNKKKRDATCSTDDGICTRLNSAIEPAHK